MKDSIEIPRRALAVLEKYYEKGTPLYETLVGHSMSVARKALDCMHRRNLALDEEFIVEAAMLHDIGVGLCDAPGIYCTGSLPYICHGVEGRRILEAEGLRRHALVCERHTGSGLTVEDIKNQQLPLPLRDMTPQTVEERLICYADKFFSKSGDVEREKDWDRVVKSMSVHGEGTLHRFLKLHEEFGELSLNKE